MIPWNTNSSAARASIAIFPFVSLRQVPLQFAIFLLGFLFNECSLISLLHYTAYAQLQYLTRLIIVHRNHNGLRDWCRIAIYLRHSKGHGTHYCIRIPLLAYATYGKVKTYCQTLTRVGKNKIISRLLDVYYHSVSRELLKLLCTQVWNLSED